MLKTMNAMIGAALLLAGCDNRPPQVEQATPTPPVDTYSTTENSDASGSEPSAPSAGGLTGSDLAFVQSFMGHCVLNYADLSRIDAAAETQKWKQITDPAALKSIGPDDGGKDWKAWTFKSEKVAFVLTHGRSTLDGLPTKFCVTISKPENPTVVKDRIIELTGATFVKTFDQNGQTYSIYQMPASAKPTYLTFIDASALGVPGFNASISGME